MAEKIAIYIPSLNGAKELETLWVPDGPDIIVMDNASSDNTGEICRKRGFKFVPNTSSVSRTQNWLRCLQHFDKSEYEWMKWLFIGDELEHNAYSVMKQAIDRFPEASLIVFSYDMILPNEIYHWTMPITGFDSRYISTHELLRSAALGGNVFGAPVASMISRKAVSLLGDPVKVDLRGYEWAADFLLHLKLALTSPAARSNNVIGRFYVSRRKYYARNMTSYRSIIEEMEMRILILDQCRAAGIADRRIEEAIKTFCLSDMRCCYLMNVDLIDLQKRMFGREGGEAPIWGLIP